MSTNPQGSRAAALAAAQQWFDGGGLLDVVSRRVAYRTESQSSDPGARLQAYLVEEIGPAIAALGGTWRLVDNPSGAGGPLLIGERHEGADLPTVLTYGHADVVRGYDEQWRTGLSPWQVVVQGERWYGRGTADNKGQHSVNLAALAQVLATRGRLGFNIRFLFETGEELGSPGLKAVCQQERQALTADVLIASDGPRLRADAPTLFLGSRGAFNFDLIVDLRDAGHHSGNWGGLIANPGTLLANAIACMVDGRGVIQVDGLRPPPIPASVRRELSRIEPGEPGGPPVEVNWGEPGLTPSERVFGWNALEVLAFQTGNPAHPVNAIPPRASAHMQLRFVVGTDVDALERSIRDHLDSHGFERVQVRASRAQTMPATRLDPDHPWVRRVAESVQATTGAAPAILPNLGGSLPNDWFADVLGMPTVWVPHSYPSCAQHAPNEHVLAPVMGEGLRIMTGLFWDVGAPGEA